MEEIHLPDSILFCDLSDRMIAIIHPCLLYTSTAGGRAPDGRGGFAAYRIQPNSECRRPRARQSEPVSYTHLVDGRGCRQREMLRTVELIEMLEVPFSD